MNKVNIIGAGIAGIATAIKLTVKGYQVEVFEKNAKAGGRFYEINENGFRFDSQTTLLHTPQLIADLFLLACENPSKYLSYNQLEISHKYFFEDKTVVNAYKNIFDFAFEIANKTGEPKDQVLDYIENARLLFNLTNEVYFQNSIHKLKNYKTKPYLLAAFFFRRLDLFKTLHQRNSKTFQSPKTVQIFDSLATLVGSNPYEAKATLKILSYFEFGAGTFLPQKGFYQIVEALVQLALKKGVTFHFNSRVESISVKNKKVEGLIVGGKLIQSDITISDIDIYNVYSKLLSDVKTPAKVSKSERSTSILNFYWGIKKSFPELDIHNILFSNDYKEEFNNLFKSKTIHNDPTISILITSKLIKTDAPKNQENWVVSVIVPENNGQNWERLISESRKNIVQKINKILKTDIETLIVFEQIATPQTNLGSQRPSNFCSDFSNLYFVGNSVYPVGGEVLNAFSSAIIVDKEIPALNGHLRIV